MRTAREIADPNEAATASDGDDLRHEEAEYDALETVQEIEPAVEHGEDAEIEPCRQEDRGKRHAEHLDAHARADPDRRALHERPVRDV